MSGVTETIRIDATPEAVWAVMTDVERWPEWTGTTRSLKRGEPGPLVAGSTARIALKGQLPTTWRVTEFVIGRSFTWQSTVMPGFRAIAGHVLEPDGSGTKVVLTAKFSGPMAAVFAPLFGRMTRRNVRLEAEGLKRRVETMPATSTAAG